MKIVMKRLVGRKDEDEDEDEKEKLQLLLLKEIKKE